MFPIYSIIKRIIDIILSFLAIILLLPLIILLSLTIKVDSKGPVFFRQVRVGKNKSLFYILKFRTMRIDTPMNIPTHLLSDPDAYITKVGRFLRRTSLDELPQIFNILLGQMSIIGPRPALWNQYDLIDERDQYGVNDIKPGLTGWAQINGRDELPIPIKARLDGEYADDISFLMDVRCFFGTIVKVIKKDGIVEGNCNLEKEDTWEHKERNIM